MTHINSLLVQVEIFRMIDVKAVSNQQSYIQLDVGILEKYANSDG